jgi:Subtilase family
MRFEDGVEAPFEDEYPEPDPTPADRRAGQLASSMTAESVGCESLPAQKFVFETLAGRRAALTNDTRTLEYAELDDRTATIIFRGQILLRRLDYDAGDQASDARRLHAAALRAYLAGLGWVEVDLGCEELRADLVRLDNQAVDWRALRALTDTLRLRGIACTADYLSALAGPVGKALSAPFPSSPLPPFVPVEPTDEPIRVAVVDSGIDRNRTDGWLAGITRVAEPDQLYDMNGELQRSAGHGTFVAGIIQRTAPAAEITMYRIDGLADGAASEVAVACAIIRAANPRDGEGNCLPKPHVINLSLGCQTLDDLPPLGLEAALKRVSPDTVVVAAAGNYGDTRPCWPGAFRRVVSVGGLTAGMEPAPWSTSGFWVDASAVGEGLRSTYVKGTPSSAFAPPTQPTAQGPRNWTADNPWALWVGTSFAAPQVAGAIALMCDRLQIDPHQALTRLLQSGRPLPGFGQALQILPGV